VDAEGIAHVVRVVVQNHHLDGPACRAQAVQKGEAEVMVVAAARENRPSRRQQVSPDLLFEAG